MYHKIVNDKVAELDVKRRKLAQACCSAALDELVAATQSILEDSGFSVFGGVKRGRSKASSTSPELRKRTAMRRDLCDLRRQVRASKNSRSDAELAEVRRRATVVLGEAVAQNVTAQDDDASMASLEVHITDRIREIRKKVKAETRKLRGHPANLKSRLFESASGRRTYYDLYFRGKDGVRMTVSRAKDEKGTVHTDPDVYVDMVKEMVGRPFAVRYEGPAVTQMRDLSENEMKTNRPDWWNKLYSRDSKTYQHTCGPVSCAKSPSVRSLTISEVLTRESHQKTTCRSTS
jgi:hypothetical protein